MLAKQRRSCVPVKRSMQSALKFFGIDAYWDGVHHISDGQVHSFWMRHEDDLHELAYDVRRAIHARIKEARTDLIENHESAVQIVEVYVWLKKQFRKRGVRL